MYRRRHLAVVAEELDDRLRRRALERLLDLLPGAVVDALRLAVLAAQPADEVRVLLAEPLETPEVDRLGHRVVEVVRVPFGFRRMHDSWNRHRSTSTWSETPNLFW